MIFCSHSVSRLTEYSEVLLAHTLEVNSWRPLSLWQKKRACRPEYPNPTSAERNKNQNRKAVAKMIEFPASVAVGAGKRSCIRGDIALDKNACRADPREQALRI